MENFPKNETEAEPKILFRVILIRHEETEYTGKGSDLTEQGEIQAKKTGKNLRTEVTPESLLIHSPATRARSTLEKIAQGAGITSPKMHVSHHLQPVVFPDEDAKTAFVAHYRGALEGNPSRYAQEFHARPEIYEGMPEVLEPKSKIKKRFYKSLGRLVRWAQKQQIGGNTPQIVAVSHFEGITQFLDDVFGIETIGCLSPDFGERIFIEARGGDNGGIILSVRYKEHSCEVLFNTKTKEVETLSA